jgi:energy-coupling factor transporter ATP-binding protein EcfA2
MSAPTDTIPALPLDAAPAAGAKSPRHSKAAAKKEQPDAIAAAARSFWRYRALHGPVTGAGAAYLIGQVAYRSRGGQDTALTVGATVIGLGAFAAYRYLRARAGRPLVLGQRLWQWAVTGAATVYFGLSSVAQPRSAPMLIVLAVLDLPIAVTWWARGHIIDAPAATAALPQAPAAPAETPSAEEPADRSGDTHPQAAAYRDAWNRGLAGPGGRLPGSALAAIHANPDEQGGGLITRVVLDAHDGAVNHTPRHVLAHKELIHQALLRVNPGLHPTNLMIEAQSNGTAILALLKHNPLTKGEFAQPSPPGSFTHRVGRTPLGRPVTMTLYEPGFGRRHRAIVGSTGSGKSTVLNLLIGLDGHTLTADGQPLVCPVICDPHGGVSYAPWHGKVRIASTPEQIAGALLLACSEIKRRLEWMRANKVDLVVPSPQMPLIPIYLDEILSARRACAAAGYPIEPMLETIANEGRKTGVTEDIGMPAFSEEVLYSTLILDALSGMIAILRSKAASTGLKVNTGNWDDALNPQKIPAKFADGTPTSGLGYYVSDDGTPVTIRYDRTDDSIAANAQFADGGPISHVPFVNVLPEPDEKGKVANVLADVAYWAEEFTRRADAGEAWTITEDAATRLDEDTEPADETPRPATPDGAGDGQAEDDFDPDTAAAQQPSLMDIVTGTAADGDAWERLRAVMAGSGIPLSVDDLHQATGIPKSTISMAFSRRRDKTPPQLVRIQEGRSVWYALPEFADVPPLQGASR